LAINLRNFFRKIAQNIDQLMFWIIVEVCKLQMSTLLKICCTKCDVCVRQLDNGIISRYYDVDIEYEKRANGRHKNFIDISDSHNAIAKIVNTKLDEITDRNLPEYVYAIIELDLLSEYHKGVKTVSKISGFNYGALENHVLLMNPGLMLPFLSENSILKLSEINYDWTSCADFLPKYVMRVSSTTDVVRMLDLIELYYQIDYKSVAIDFMLECIDSKIDVRLPCRKITNLLEAGFNINKDLVMSNYFVFHAVMDESIDIFVDYGLKHSRDFTIKFDFIINAIEANKIDKLVECGLNIESSIKVSDFRAIKLMDLDIFLEIYPMYADAIFKNIINYNHQPITHLVSKYHVDVASVIKEVIDDNASSLDAK
jgi:hypothetical protein